MLVEAESRGEPVYGISPWYCSASIIENGAEVAFIGANPGGGPESEEADRRLGRLNKPYNDKLLYNAWLDDRHWSGDGPNHQARAIEAFGVLFGPQGRETLRNAACFNVVPLRSCDVKKLSKATWQSGVNWVTVVVEHVRPSIIVCNGSGESRSAWGVFRDRRFGIEEPEEAHVYGAHVYGTYWLKRGRISRGKLEGAEVIGLPHLAHMWSIPRLRAAARRLGYLYKFILVSQGSLASPPWQ